MHKSIRQDRRRFCGQLFCWLLLTGWPVVGTSAEVAMKSISLQDDQGHKLFELKPRDDGAKLFDGAGKELARFVLSESKVKIKDSADKPLGNIDIHSEKLRLEIGEQKTVALTLQRQPDGDWKVENAKGQRIGTIKIRDYGAELEDPQKKSLYKVKMKSGKTSLRNADDKSVYTTHDHVLPAAMACLGLDEVADIRLRAALLFVIERDFHK